MIGAPRVLVVARYGDAEQAGRVVRSLAGQTYSNAGLVFICAPAAKNSPSPDRSLPTCRPNELGAWIKKSGAEAILFWPQEGDLKPAALEKLVLALQLTPDQNGVADSARGSTGLWLARNIEAMRTLIRLWPVSQLDWISECQKNHPALFYIDENLLDHSGDLAPCRPYAVEDHFHRLLPLKENYQDIPVDPIWPLPETKTDDRSVLILISCLPMGGACKFILDVAGQLKSRGYRVMVATTLYSTHNPNPWLDELLKIIPDVFVLPNVRPTEVPRLIVHLARSRGCGRVIISHSMLGYQLLPWLRRQLPDVSFLDYTHIEYESEYPNGGYAQRSVSNQALLDISMVSSRHLRDWMTAAGAEADNLRVCSTNIDTEKWTPDPKAREEDRRTLGIAPGTALILYPCRIAEQKRPELMCNIVAGLRRVTTVPFIVLVAGDGPLMSPLKKFVQDQNLGDCVLMPGAVSLERVARLHNAADIFLLPSFIEGIALALFEAMALESVPVVADVGGQRELVTSDCGYLVPLGEPAEELRAYISALKNLLENPVERQSMATASRKRIQNHFRLSQMTTTFISTMHEAGHRLKRRPVPLPDERICREIATLAIDHVRVQQDLNINREMGELLQVRLEKQERINGKLQRQVEAIRNARTAPEVNELAC